MPKYRNTYIPKYRPRETHTPYGVMLDLQRYAWTRLHMFLIVAASIAAAVLATRVLLDQGVTAMWVRYLCALVLAYGSFFAGVWVWLHLSPYGRHLRAQRKAEKSHADGGIDLPTMQLGGSPEPMASSADFHSGGGHFDGGGAAADWGTPSAELSVELPKSGVLDNLSGVADVGGDEGGCLLVLAAALLMVVLAVLLGAAGYVIFQAPAILAEVAFEVLLASPLARGARAVASPRWGRALLARTWKPFALMAGAALGFAVFCANYFPTVSTAGQFVQMLLGL